MQGRCSHLQGYAGAAYGTPLRIPEVVDTLGLVLFAYTGGANSQPAVLAFADERTGFDVRVGLG